MHESIVSIKLALRNLRANTGRTVLSLAGVVIGITSVIVISSAGQGVKSFVLGQVGSFGTDIIQIEIKVPATGKTSAQNIMGQAQGIQITTMSIEDSNALSKVPNVSAVASGTMAQELVSYQNINKRSFIFGVGSQYIQIDQNVKLAGGSFFDQNDDENLAQVVFIGSAVKEAFFGDDNPVGKNIKIKSQSYKVIGFAEPRGAIAGFNYDDIIYIPVETVQKKILGVDFIRFIMVKVADEKIIDATANDLTLEMRSLHKITDPDKDDFSVTSIKEAQEMIAEVFGVINILLLVLTSVSLVVGGVGIMNVMYVAVAERTFEIGLRKAVGAKSGNILKQFLWEAVFITFCGGAIGIFLGFLFTLLLSYIFSLLGFDLKLETTLQSIFIATVFSVTVGIIFGYYPARNAAKLSPMEALRRE